jgi:hypothetical protein
MPSPLWPKDALGQQATSYLGVRARGRGGCPVNSAVALALHRAANVPCRIGVSSIPADWPRQFKCAVIMVAAGGSATPHTLPVPSSQPSTKLPAYHVDKDYAATGVQNPHRWFGSPTAGRGLLHGDWLLEWMGGRYLSHPIEEWLSMAQIRECWRLCAEHAGHRWKALERRRARAHAIGFCRNALASSWPATDLSLIRNWCKIGLGTNAPGLGWDWGAKHKTLLAAKTAAGAGAGQQLLDQLHLSRHFFFALKGEGLVPPQSAEGLFPMNWACAFPSVTEVSGSPDPFFWVGGAAWLESDSEVAEAIDAFASAL